MIAIITKTITLLTFTLISTLILTVFEENMVVCFRGGPSIGRLAVIQQSPQTVSTMHRHVRATLIILINQSVNFLLSFEDGYVYGRMYDKQSSRLEADLIQFRYLY